MKTKQKQTNKQTNKKYSLTNKQKQQLLLERKNKSIFFFQDTLV